MMFGLRPRVQYKKNDQQDLGFGSVVASGSAARLLNRDGSFNNRRTGLGPLASLHVFDALLTMSWPRFLLLVGSIYMVSNALFAVAYLSLGTEALASSFGPTTFRRAFFFSVHTLSTVGYGSIVPASLAANALMTIESIYGIFGVAITTGIVFARFSRPIAKILFSDKALVAPYRDGRALMFRISNQRSTQIIELEATVVFSRIVEQDGRRVRQFWPLPLEREKVMFFPLAWTIVHPIDKESPLHEMTSEECLGSDAEILILIKGVDETFSQLVHRRTSYKADEMVWAAKFSDIYVREDDRIVGIDLSRLSDYERVT